MSQINLGKVVGDDGKSAYEIAVDEGFVGTEQEWLDSLQANAMNTRVVRNTNTIIFNVDAQHGTYASPISGNITITPFDGVTEKILAAAWIYHEDTEAPEFTATGFSIGDIYGQYIPNQLNQIAIFFTSPNRVEIQYRNLVTGSPGVSSWNDLEDIPYLSPTASPSTCEFSSPFGKLIGAPNAPLDTDSFSLSSTDEVFGGFTVIYSDAASLPTFTGAGGRDVVVRGSDNFLPNETNELIMTLFDANTYYLSVNTAPVLPDFTLLASKDLPQGVTVTFEDEDEYVVSQNIAGMEIPFLGNVETNTCTIKIPAEGLSNGFQFLVRNKGGILAFETTEIDSVFVFVDDKLNVLTNPILNEKGRVHITVLSDDEQIMFTGGNITEA